MLVTDLDRVAPAIRKPPAPHVPPAVAQSPWMDDHPTDPADFEAEPEPFVEPSDLRWLGTGLIIAFALICTASYVALLWLGMIR